jgi:hypothetical protein
MCRMLEGRGCKVPADLHMEGAVSVKGQLHRRWHPLGPPPSPKEFPLQGRCRFWQQHNSLRYALPTISVTILPMFTTVLRNQNPVQIQRTQKTKEKSVKWKKGSMHLPEVSVVCRVAAWRWWSPEPNMPDGAVGLRRWDIRHHRPPHKWPKGFLLHGRRLCWHQPNSSLRYALPVIVVTVLPMLHSHNPVQIQRTREKIVWNERKALCTYQKSLLYAGRKINSGDLQLRTWPMARSASEGETSDIVVLPSHGHTPGYSNACVLRNSITWTSSNHIASRKQTKLGLPPPCRGPIWPELGMCGPFTCTFEEPKYDFHLPSPLRRGLASTRWHRCCNRRRERRHTKFTTTRLRCNWKLLLFYSRQRQQWIRMGRRCGGTYSVATRDASCSEQLLQMAV